MVRVKRGKIKRRRKKRVLVAVKGFRGAKRIRYRLAKQALTRALLYAYRDRRRKKREMRRLWQMRINAKVRDWNMNYSRFVHLLKEKKIELDRKILALLAKKFPKIFDKIVEISKS